MEVADEDWCTRLSAALTAQLASFYEPESLEKAFALRALGHVTRLLTSDQLILDNLSALYLAVTHTAMESACAKAFGNLKINYLCTYDLYSPVHNVLDASITRRSGRGLGPGIREFFGPCEMASSR